MSDERDQTRLISKTGTAFAASFQDDINSMMDGLLAMQIKAFEDGNIELAEDIARLMEHPQRLSEKLDKWAAGDIKGLMRLVRRKK